MARGTALDDLLTTTEAARLLGRAPRTVRGYIARGLLPVARQVNPRLFLVRPADVEGLRGRLPVQDGDPALASWPGPAGKEVGPSG